MYTRERKNLIPLVEVVCCDLHLDTRIKKKCILINVSAPKLEYAGEVWEGNAKFVKQLETAVLMIAAERN